jgi:hypothetical protein
MRLSSVDKALIVRVCMLIEKKRPFQCLDEFNSFDEEEAQEDDEHAQSSYSDNIPQTCTSFEEV